MIIPIESLPFILAYIGVGVCASYGWTKYNTNNFKTLGVNPWTGSWYVATTVVIIWSIISIFVWLPSMFVDEDKMWDECYKGWAL